MALTRPRFTQLNTTVTTLTDTLTVLNGGSTTANLDVGFVINRDGGTTANTALFWDESANTFVTAFTTTSGASNSNVAIAEYANIRAGYFIGDGSQLSNVGGYGDSNVAAYLTTYTGNIAAGNLYAGTLYGNIGGGSTLPNVYITGSLIPTANVAYDLGTPTQKFRSAYFSGSTIYLGDESISVDSSGKWSFTSKGAAVEMGKDHDFNPPNANISGNVTATSFNFANGVSIVTTLSNAITTANTNLKSYVDGEVSTLSNSISGANSAITTANTNMKGYVDSIAYGNTSVAQYLGNVATIRVGKNDPTFSYVDLGADNLTLNACTAVAVTTTIGSITLNSGSGNVYVPSGNITTPGIKTDNYYYANGASLITAINNSIAGANSAITTANTNMKGYVDGEISTLTSNAGVLAANIQSLTNSIAGANSAITTANTNMKGYVDGEILTLTSNAGAQASSISDLQTNKANLASPTFSGTVTITGNLSVTGTQTTFNSNNLTLNDSLLYLAHGNSGDALDIGIASSFNNGVYQHGGFVRDASDSVWKLFSNVVAEPSTTIDFTHAIWDTLLVGSINARGNLTVGTGASTGIVKSNSTYDLKLTTNDGSSNNPSITLTQSDDGNITLDPSGAGVTKVIGHLYVGDGSTEANISSLGAQNLVISTNRDLGRAYIKLSSGTNGNIDFNINGTGTINVPQITFADGYTLAGAVFEISDNSGSSVAVDGNITLAVDNSNVVVVNSSGVNITGGLNLTGTAQYGSSFYISQQYISWGTTTNATETELFVSGVNGARIPVETNTTMLYEIDIVARRTDVTGESASWHIKGCADNFSDTVADVGDIYEIIISRDDTTWTVDARADNTNNSINIYVTGAAGKNIRWTAVVKTIEVAQ